MENLNVINTFIGATIPLVILYLGIRLERQRNKVERIHEIRIQFDLEGKILGPQAGYYILDLSAILQNKGLVRLVIDELELKLRGIEQETDIELYDENLKESSINRIARFPIELVKTDMLQAVNTHQEEGRKDGYFVEPGVEQRFSYVARIPENISFIFVRAYFKYGNNQDKKSEHSAQTILELKPPDQ